MLSETILMLQLFHSVAVSLKRRGGPREWRLFDVDLDRRRTTSGAPAREDKKKLKEPKKRKEREKPHANDCKTYLLQSLQSQTQFQFRTRGLGCSAQILQIRRTTWLLFEFFAQIIVIRSKCV